MRESETRRRRYVVGGLDEDEDMRGSRRGEARRVGGEGYEGAAGRARRKMMMMAKSDGKESTMHYSYSWSCRRCSRTLLSWIGNVW